MNGIFDNIVKAVSEGVYNLQQDLEFGFRRPIRVNGVSIGYIDKTNQPCIGNAFIYSQFLDANHKPIYPPAMWMTQDYFGRELTVTEYCLDRNITPNWAAVQGGKVTVPAQTNGAAPLSFTRQANGTFALDADGKLGANIPGTPIPIGIAIGAAAVVGLVWVTRR